MGQIVNCDFFQNFLAKALLKENDQAFINESFYECDSSSQNKKGAS